VPASPPAKPVGAQPVELKIRSEPLLLKLDEPGLRRIGKLLWRGGVSMTAHSANFGGWSDLDISPDGRTLTSISDVGGWLTATIEYDSEGNLAGLSNGRIGSLRGLDGQPLTNKVDADAEGMARLGDGSWLVAFERDHRIWRYRTLTATPTPVDGRPTVAPARPTAASRRCGARRRPRHRDQRGIQPSRTSWGWIGTPTAAGRYQWRSFNYATIPDFRRRRSRRCPTASFGLLERAFDMARGVRCRVMRFDAAQLVAGGTVQAEELARLASPYAVDNLEGIAATRGRAARRCCG
jgi:hypothetical protein